MRIFRFLLLMCIPAIFLSALPVSTNEHPTLTKIELEESYFIPKDGSGNINPWELFKIEKLSYNNILSFLKALEQDSFWEELNVSELDTVVNYLIWSMRSYAPFSRLDLREQAEQAIEELEEILSDRPVWYYSDNPEEFDYIPAKDLYPIHIIKCGWVGDKWKELKKWAKKNKGPLIICAVAATVIVIGALTGGVGGSTAAAVGGALVGSNMDAQPPPDHINKPGEVLIYSPEPSNVPAYPEVQTFFPPPNPTPPLPQHPLESPQLSEKIENLVSVVDAKKEEVITSLETIGTNPTPEKQASFAEYLRDQGCSLGHSIVDGVASVMEYLYEDVPLNDYLHFLANIDYYHDKIDQAFSFDERGEFDKWQMQTGTPPTIVPGGNALIQGGKVAGAAAGGAIIGELLTTATAPIVIEQGNISVYKAFNELTGEVSYVGITNNFERRYAEHLENKNIKIR